MNRVIISGADGFVGSQTVVFFLSQGIEVLALDQRLAPKRLVFDKHLRYLKCDISDTKAMLNIIESDYYDTFIHFAWEGSAGPLRGDYNLQIQNAINTVECMKVAKTLGCTRFVGIGSIMEYEVEVAMHAQGSKPGINYIYGIGKHVAHSMCKSVAADIGIDLVWPMITNAYGVGEYSPRFINTTIRRIINGEPLQFTAATQNYDFIYISDVAEAIYNITKNGIAFCEYIIGSGKAKTLKDFILELQSTCAPQVELIFGDVPFTGINMPLSVFDICKTTKDTGFIPKISFSEGVRLTMEWLETVEK